jgi:hypothetical protein
VLGHQRHDPAPEVLRAADRDEEGLRRVLAGLGVTRRNDVLGAVLPHLAPGRRGLADVVEHGGGHHQVAVVALQPGFVGESCRHLGSQPRVRRQVSFGVITGESYRTRAHRTRAERLRGGQK